MGAVMALISCWECGKKISDQAAACPNCGAPITVCRECGKQISDQTVVCPNCAAPTTGRYQPAVTPVVSKPPRNRSTAILLALLLGGLGIHKFYLEKPRSGFWRILFSWTLFPAIIGFIDGIR